MLDETPEIVGRDDDDFLDVRSRTRRRASVTHQFVSGATGDAHVELFESLDDEDRGGVVLRLRVYDGGSSMVPWTRNVPHGAEVHLGGEAEAEALCVALIQALAARGSRTILMGSRIAIADPLELAE